MKIKLLYKFIFILLFISILPLAVVGIKMTDLNKSALEEATLHNHIATAGFLARNIDNFISSLREKLVFLITSQSLESLDFDGKQALVQALLSSTESFITVSMVNSEGEEFLKTYHPDYAAEAQIKDLSGTDIFVSAKKGPSVSSVYTEGAEPRMDIMYPLAGDYIFITITMQSLWEDIKKADIGKEAKAFLVDGDGIVLAHPDHEKEGRRYDIPPVKEVLRRAGTGSMEYELDSQIMVGAYSPVESMGWGIVTQQPYEYAYESAIMIKKSAYRLMVLMLFVVVILSHFLARGLSRPVFEIIKGAKAVASGDFTQTVGVNTKDELQLLADTFNNMVRALKKYEELQVDKIIAERTKTDSIVYSIDNGIILTDFSGHLMLINDRARELLGISADTGDEKAVADYVTDERLRQSMSEFCDCEVDLSTEGSRKVVRITTEEVKTTDGKELGKMRIISDITLQKEIEELKDRFMHSVTHDLKNPLLAIMGMSQLLERLRTDELSDAEKKYYSIIKEEGDRLMGMISDILNLAKLESGKLELDKTDFPIDEVIDKIVEAHTPQAQNSGITLSLEVKTSPIIINADKSLIERVILNLLTNAIKFTPRNGSIIIKGAVSEEGVRVSVKDTGKGIPKSMTEQVFNRFQQVEKGARHGAGIGLNIVKEVIEAHGGSIWVESELGKGSEFVFIVPAK